jgi:hypothetical protein
MPDPMRSFVFVGFALFAACSAPPMGDCTPRNCNGCCDSKGACRSGAAKDACGSGGFTCAVCATNQRCSATLTCEVDPNAPQGGGSAGGGAPGGGTGGGGPATMEQEFVNAHNAARRRATPAPSPALPDVTWDATVAAFAKEGSDRCIMNHRQQNQYGENLYAGTAPATPTEIVDSWDSEKQDYDYATNRCTRVCGHYTQVVWRTSVRIGCSTTLCTMNSPFGGGSWYLTACNYAPPGNYVGQKPY